MKYDVGGADEDDVMNRKMNKPFLVLGLVWFAMLGSSLLAQTESAADKCAAIRGESPDPDEIRAIAASNGRVTGMVACCGSAHQPVNAHYRDVLQEGGSYVRYEYQGILPQTEFHIVRVQYYEGNAYEIVGPKGQSRLVGLPVLSPDRRRVFASSLDL